MLLMQHPLSLQKNKRRMNVYVRLLGFLSDIKKEIAGKTLLGLVISATYLVQAVLMAQIVNLVFGSQDKAELFLRLAAVVAAILIRSWLMMRNESYTKTMAQKIKGKIRSVVLEHMFRLGPGQMNDKRSGELTSLVLDGVEALEHFYVSFIPQVFTVLIVGGFSFFYLLQYDPLTSVILILAMVLCVVVPIATIPIVEKNIGDYWTDYSRLTAQYIDAVQGLTTLKTLDAEKSMGSILKKEATSFWRRSIKNTGISLSNASLMLILTSVTSSITVVIAALRAYNGTIEAAAVPVFLFLTVECARPLFDLNRYWHSSFLGLSTAEGLFELMDTEPKIVDREDAAKNGIEEMPEIRFENVTFSYTGSEDVLKDVSFTISKGSKTAIVGRSGSGKSTIVNLLIRFYDPQEGAIKISGKDMRDYELSYLQSRMSAVFQDTFLFYGTVRENIRMSRPDATDEEIVAAARLARADEFIDKLPEGYDTIVGERGLTLSGGERQRISIARAIIKDSPVMILDEATASVDAESEKLIQNAIDELSRKRTSVIVAHRLSTVRDADNIIVLENGTVAEQGTHEELLAKKGIYHELIKAQEEIKNV